MQMEQTNEALMALSVFSICKDQGYFPGKHMCMHKNTLSNLYKNIICLESRVDVYA